MDDTKNNENNTNFKKFLNNDNEKFDTSLFDETLSQIEENLKSLDKKTATKETKSIKNIEEKKFDTYEEHEIDNSHMRMDDLHNFSSETKIKQKSSFGFYTYLFLFIGIIFGIYETIKSFKELIVLKFPITEIYIQYFYEIIEILAYIILNIFSFIKNLF